MTTRVRKPLPKILAVTLLGLASTGCGAPTPAPTDCPSGCGRLIGPDGGPASHPDGGPYCLC